MVAGETGETGFYHLRVGNGDEMISKKIGVVSGALLLGGCATLTTDAMMPVAFSFSDGSSGRCAFENKRGLWEAEIPANVSIRRSDDVLKYRCETQDSRRAMGSIPSTINTKIVAGAVFFSLGIIDAITDKHRDYPSSYVIPIRAK